MLNEASSQISQYKMAARSIRQHLISAPDLRKTYEVAKHIIHLFSRPGFYEISDRCNLKCEGCYYFDPEVFQGESSNRDAFDNNWNALLKQEVARGVTMPYFLGAEPALEKKRLLEASRHFTRANVGTNGTIFIDPEIPFRISISAWAADEADDARFRGGSVFRKALKLYQGDPRTIVLYTLNRCNIHQTKEMVHLCQEHGLPVTFSLWSPTLSLKSRLARFTGNDKAFFRISTPESSLLFSDDDLLRTRETLDELIEDYPDTVIYSHAYNRWATTPGPLYNINPDTGVAENCSSRIIGNLKYYDMDLQSREVKCCTPAIDCQECRLYSGGWSSQFAPTPEQVATLDGFSEWLDIILTLGRIFLRPETDPQAFDYDVANSDVKQ